MNRAPTPLHYPTHGETSYDTTTAATTAAMSTTGSSSMGETTLPSLTATMGTMTPQLMHSDVFSATGAIPVNLVDTASFAVVRGGGGGGSGAGTSHATAGFGSGGGDCSIDDTMSSSFPTTATITTTASWHRMDEGGLLPSAPQQHQQHHQMRDPYVYYQQQHNMQPDNITASPYHPPTSTQGYPAPYPSPFHSFPPLPLISSLSSGLAGSLSQPEPPPPQIPPPPLPHMGPPASVLSSTVTASSSMTASSPVVTTELLVWETYEKMDTARQQLALMEEKLRVERALLKQDQRNFKRRLRAVKATFAERQAAVLQQEEELQQQLQRERKQREELEQQHAVVVRSLHHEIQRLERAQQRHFPTESDANKGVLEKKEVAATAAPSSTEQTKTTSTIITDSTEPNGNENGNLTEQLKQMEVRLEEQTKMVDLLQDKMRIADAETSSLSLQTLEAELAEKTAQCAALEVRVQKLEQRQVLAPDAVQALREEVSALQTENATLRLEVSDADRWKELNQDLRQQLNNLLLSSSKSTTPSTESTNLAENQRLPTDVASIPGTPSPDDHDFVLEKEWSGADTYNGLYTGWIDRTTGQPNGSGTLRMDDGAVYNGQWKQGLFHGEGVLATVEGDLFHGSWRDGKQDGWAVTCWSDGRVYQGPYRLGKRHGRDAAMTWPYGAHYRGDFVEDRRNGPGTYVYADGRCYKGQYKDDRPHGYGIMTASDGVVLYDGQWELGEFLKTE